MKINLIAKIIAAFLFFAIVLCGAASAKASGEFVPYNTVETFFCHSDVSQKNVDYPDLGLTCKSAVLMEASTGEILYAHNETEALPPASVTKVMTLLLIMEAIESGAVDYDDTVTASAEAASMGGSQIYLKEGESMSVNDLLKSVVIASANDAAVALAEHIAGSEEAFVARMNARAEELGMTSTKFENTNGLDDTTTEHFTSALDIAIMSRELIKHKKILEYSSTWMDTIRDGSFGLTNTNRLIRFYKGATGLKTGSTSKAKFCISATAQREGLHLIAVIMGSDTRDTRNDAAKTLLDWGFANYSVYRNPAASLPPVPVLGGISDHCAVEYEEFCCLTGKGKEKAVTYEIVMPPKISAPVCKGDVIGQVVYRLGGEQIGQRNIIASESVEKICFGVLFLRMLKTALLPF